MLFFWPIIHYIIWLEIFLFASRVHMCLQKTILPLNEFWVVQLYFLSSAFIFFKDQLLAKYYFFYSSVQAYLILLSILCTHWQKMRHHLWLLLSYNTLAKSWIFLIEGMDSFRVIINIGSGFVSCNYYRNKDTYKLTHRPIKHKDCIQKISSCLKLTPTATPTKSINDGSNLRQ